MDKISLTGDAISHLRKNLQSDKMAVGIKIGVKDSGCSGKSYLLNFCYEIASNDLVFVIDDIKVVVSEEDYKYLQGTEVDCVKEGINEYIKFNNPNVAAECGCGESFTIKDEEVGKPL